MGLEEMKGVKIKAFLLVVDGRARCHAQCNLAKVLFFAGKLLEER